MLKSLEEITHCKDYYIDTETIDIISFKKYPEGKKIKVFPVNLGYLQVQMVLPEGRKYFSLHYLVARALINSNFDKKKQQIIFKDGNNGNCHPSNLEIVTGLKRKRKSKKPKKEPVEKRNYRKSQPIYPDLDTIFDKWIDVKR